MSVDLDQGGLTFQKANIYLGPSLGWAPLRVRPERFITAGGTYAIGPDDGVVFVNVAATVTLNLPDVAAWMKEPAYQPITSFERAIWVKDLGHAASFNITVQSFGGQIIDASSSVVMNTNYQILRLYPLSDLSGWFVG